MVRNKGNPKIQIRDRLSGSVSNRKILKMQVRHATVAIRGWWPVTMKITISMLNLGRPQRGERDNGLVF